MKKNSYRDAARGQGTDHRLEQIQKINKARDANGTSEPTAIVKAREYIEAWSKLSKECTVGNALAFAEAGKALKEVL